MNSFVRWICALLISVAVGLPASHAAPSAEVTKGTTWLQSQVQADGSLSGEASSLATALQARAETLVTLKLLATTPSQLADSIGIETEDNTEYLSRRIIAASLVLRPASTLIAQLNARQNLDGGLGGSVGHESGVLDTAYALIAYSIAGQSASASASAARNFLSASVQTDGGMAGSSDAERVAGTALALSALQGVPADANSFTAINRLTSWLLQRQGADGSWLQDTTLSGLVLLAIAPVVSDTNVVAIAQSYLLGLQSVDGSWGADPFVTAVILRALSAQAGSVSTPQAAITGTVLDQNTGTALSAATVTVTGAGTATTQSGQEGRFQVANLASGSYTVQIQKAGYTSFSKTYALATGQTLDTGAIALAQLPSAGIVRGQVTAANGSPLVGVGIALSGSASLSALTDASGRFEFTGVAPGAISLSANLAGYNAASGSATLVAGQTLIFSPVLFAIGDPSSPTTGQFVGKVVAAGSNTPLAGVSIQLNGVALGTTSADGSFNLTLNPGSYAATLSLTGYDSASANFLLTAGTVVSVGTVTLNKQLTVSSISGRVTDQATGGGIAGAQVQVINGSATTAAADGSYTLTNLSETSLDIRVSATGYLSQTWQLQLSRPTDVTQDFALAVQGANSVELSGLIVTPGSATSRTDIAASASVINNGASPVSIALTMQILDAQNNVVSQGAAYDAAGTTQLGSFTVNPGQSIPVTLKWNSGQFPPGTYLLVARASEGGSFTASSPLGTVLSTRQASLLINGDQHVTGGVTADPPILQAGLSTVVHLSAVIQNDGNTSLPAQDYTLRGIDNKTGTVVLTHVVSGAAMNVGEFQTLNYPDWVPTGSGDYALEVTSNDPFLGKLIGKVYVGDAATAQFTLNKQVVLPGNQTVKGNLHVTGQDVTLGSISDPLVPLIKTAVQKGVTYGDQDASAWVLNNKCLGCHVVTQALVGGEMTRKITTYNTSQRNTLYNSLATYLQSNGALYASHPEYSRTQTMLGAWSINAWHKKSSIADTLSRVSGYLMSVQESSGRWTADHASGWWASPVANTAFNTKSLIDISASLKNAPANSVGSYTTSTLVSTNISSPFHMEPDASGNLFVSNSNGTVVQVQLGGSTQVLMSGLSNPRGIVTMSDGSILVATSLGILKRTSAGAISTFSAQAAYGLAWGPDGNLYASNPATNSLYKITPSGATTTWVSGGLLSTPQGLTFLNNGDLVVANWGNYKILRYRPNATGEAAVTWTNGRPLDVVASGDGWLTTTETGLYRYDAESHGERLLFNQTNTVATRSDGQLVIDNGASILLAVNRAVENLTAKDSAIASAVSKATNWLLTDSNINSNNNLDLAHRLIGLGAARAYYDGQSVASTIQSKIDSVGTTLKSRQRADGGWGWTTGHGSDSMVTAQVGTALDYLNPSAKDPVVQNAIKYLLSRQQGDGSWYSENGILGTHLAATTWVEIWLPIALDRLGGIDTNVTVDMPNNVTLSNPSVTPSSTSANAQGGTTYVWSLQGVTSSGRDIGFDLAFANLGVGESRAAAANAFLTFTNSFTQSLQNAPIAIPKLLGSAFMELSVTTDAASYPALSPVVIGALVKNTGLTANSGSVGLSIYSVTDNVLVTDLGNYPFSGLAASAQITLSAQWNSGTTAPGPYFVLGTLFDSQGSKAGTSKAAFSITGIGGGAGVGAKITIDKQVYQPYDLVKISDRISNLTQNQAVDGLTAVTTVTKPDGTVLWTKSALLSQLVAGAYQGLSYTVSLSNAVAGAYKASLTVLNSSGTQAAYAETIFTVDTSSSTGSGLTGTIVADPKLVPLGDAVILSSSALNAGNADLIGAVIKVTIVDPGAQTVVTEWPATVTLVQQQPYAISRTWTTQGSVGQTYVAVLTADIGGKTLTLAQDSFTLIEPPIKLDVTQTIPRQNRVLALVSCEPGEHSESSDSKSDSSSKSSSEQDDHAKQNCAVQRAQFLNAYLSAIPVEHLVVTTENDFRKAFRSGRYNVYWIAGGNVKLKDHLAEEVREAVYRGDSLILDGVHDERNHDLDEVAGIIYRGKLSATNQPITLTEATLGATGLALNTRGRPLRLERSSGLAQASFATILHADEDHDSDHKTNAIYPAIISNVYGAGRALTFAFDWLDTLRNDSLSAWGNPARAALGYVLPPVATALSARGYVPVETIIRNLAKSVDIEVAMQLPSGGQAILTEPLASLSSGQPTWQFPLPEAGEQRLLLGLSLPSLGGVHRLDTAVTTIRNTQRKLYGNYSLSLAVAAAEQIGTGIIGNLQSLTLPTMQERQARDKAVGYIQQALAALGRNDPAEAIDKLLEAVEELRKIQSRDMGANRRDIDRMLQDAAARWYAANL